MFNLSSFVAILYWSNILLSEYLNLIICAELLNSRLNERLNLMHLTSLNDNEFIELVFVWKRNQN